MNALFKDFFKTNQDGQINRFLDTFVTQLNFHSSIVRTMCEILC